MNISVIVVTYNEEKNIGKCLDSIFRLLDNSNHDFEVILVDSCSKDKTIEMVRNYDIKKISLLNLRSPSAAKFIGFQNSTGNFLLFMDGDMELLMTNKDLNNCLNYLKNKN